MSFNRFYHGVMFFFANVPISNFTCCFLFAKSISFGIFSESFVRVGVHFFKDYFLENNYLYNQFRDFISNTKTAEL